MKQLYNNLLRNYTKYPEGFLLNSLYAKIKLPPGASVLSSKEIQCKLKGNDYYARGMYFSNKTDRSQDYDISAFFKEIPPVIAEINKTSLKEIKLNINSLVPSKLPYYVLPIQQKKEALMFSAVKLRKTEIVNKFLTEGGVNIDVADENGFSSLMIAVENKDEEMVKLLLANKAKADINIPILGCSLLNYTIEKKLDNIAILLIDYLSGPALNKGTGYRSTPLFKAIENKNYLIVEKLVKAGADINLYDVFGCTPLDVTIYNNDLPMMKILLSGNQDPAFSSIKLAVNKEDLLLYLIKNTKDNQLKFHTLKYIIEKHKLSMSQAIKEAIDFDGYQKEESEILESIRVLEEKIKESNLELLSNKEHNWVSLIEEAPVDSRDILGQENKNLGSNNIFD